MLWQDFLLDYWLFVYSEEICETVVDQANRQKLNEDHVLHFSCICIFIQTNAWSDL